MANYLLGFVLLFLIMRPSLLIDIFRYLDFFFRWLLVKPWISFDASNYVLI